MMQHMPALPFNRIQRGPRSTLGRVARLLICLVCLSISLPYAAPAQTIAPAPLPPAAQQALDKGIIAAKVPDYPLAIRFFEEARKLAPQAPVVFLNLGIAESKMPSRELRAIAWFGAYLAALPEAPNAAAVRQQIDVLDVKSRSNLLRFIKVAQDAADQISEDTRLPTMGRDKQHILYQVSKLWASAGETARAQKTAGLIQSENWKSNALAVIARAQIEAADMAGASQTALRIQDKDQRSGMQKAIVEAAAKTRPADRSVVKAFDWLEKLGITTRPIIIWSLNTDLFLDLDGYLKSLPPPSKSVHAHFWALQETATKIAQAQSEIDGMLKAQFGK